MCKAEDAGAVSRLFADFLAAFNAGDASAVSALFTDNAVMMLNDGSSVIGRTAIRAAYDGFFQHFAAEQTASIEEIEVAGDWAFCRCSWKIALTPKAGGERAEPRGAALWILKRQGDGSWKGARQIFTADRFFLPPLG